MCDEIIEIVAGLQGHITATTAIATIGTALGYKCLTPKGHATAATMTGSGVYFYLIDKHGVMIPWPIKKARHITSP